MKKLITTDITTSVGMPIKGGTLRHLQESYTESIAEVVKASVGTSYSDATAYILNGIVNGSSHPTYNTSKGSIFLNGEVYLVDAASFVVSSGQVAVLVLDTSFATGTDADGVQFTDGITRNVHLIRKAKLQSAAGGTGLSNYADAQRIIANQPIVNLTQGTGIAITGAYPNLTIACTVSPNPSPILLQRKIFLGDINSSVGDGYTTLLSGGSSGFAAYLHTFPSPLPGGTSFQPVLMVGNGGHDVTSNFDDNYMCSPLLGYYDNTKMYFAVQTTATGNVQALDLWYILIQTP